MRFLIDNALSPQVSRALVGAGHDSVHVRELGCQADSDARIFARAGDERRILVSADTDFAALLAAQSTVAPSLILFRHGVEHRPARQVEILLANLDALAEDLAAGALVTIEPTRLRVRRLPIG